MIIDERHDGGLFENLERSPILLRAEQYAGAERHRPVFHVG
ncbi:MAG: hypothetical protein AB7G68_06955 [Nitrospiraceae bacterium]